MNLGQIARKLFILIVQYCFLASASIASPSGFLGCPIPVTMDSDPISDLVRDATPNHILFIGERHGTRETPAVVACLAERFLASGERIMLAFEFPAELETSLQNYYNAPSETPQLWILNNWFWRDSFYQDGRRSRAMLALLRQAWKWKKAGQKLSVHTIDIFYDPAMRNAAGVSVNNRNAFMAARLKTLIEKDKPDRVIVLVGRGHARILPYDNPAYRNDPPIPLHLNGYRIWSVDVGALDGERWSCRITDHNKRLRCGPAIFREIPQKSPSPITVPTYRRLAGDSGAAFDAELVLPEFTASPPAWKDFEWKDCSHVPASWSPCPSDMR